MSVGNIGRRGYEVIYTICMYHRLICMLLVIYFPSCWLKKAPRSKETNKLKQKLKMRRPHTFDMLQRLQLGSRRTLHVLRKLQREFINLSQDSSIHNAKYKRLGFTFAWKSAGLHLSKHIVSQLSL